MKEESNNLQGQEISGQLVNRDKLNREISNLKFDVQLRFESTVEA
jgi:hypothetical protein